MKALSFRLILSAAAALPLIDTASAAAITDVTEIGAYTLIYQLDIPDNAAYDLNAVPYGVDNSGTPLPGGVGRIAYYLELDNGGGRQWVWVSMDAFTQNLGLIGVPTLASGAQWQMKLSNMNVESNVAGIITGTGISTGNIEFWPNNYGVAAGLAGIGGSPIIYDYNDLNELSGNYGSMQVHNYGAAQTLFAYNDWGGNPTFSVDDVGIGNNPTGHPDWTFMQNANSYTLKRLEVWAQAVPLPPALYLFGAGITGLTWVARHRKRLIPTGQSGTDHA